MKKLITFLILTLVLTGCNSKATKLEQEKLNLYETYWKSILNESQFLKSSNNFDVQVELVKAGSEYEYYIAIDNAQIAMYDVEIMVVEDQMSFNRVEEMLPSAGIFDHQFNLIPNQVRNDKDFKEGAILVRQELASPTVKLQILVNWKNYTKLDSFKEFFEFDLKYEDPEIEAEDEVVEEEGES